nr:MFS transporter [Fusibacter paucivorans]
MNKAPSYRFVIWIVLTIAYINIYMGMQVIATYATSIIEDLGVSNTAISFISNGTTIMLALFSLIGGAIAMKLGGAKRTMVIGTIMMLVAGIGFLAHPNTITQLVALRLLQGIGAGLVNTFALGIAPWFPAKERGIASGIETGLYGVGLAGITLILSYFSTLGLSWSSGIGTFLCIGSALCLILILLFYTDIEKKYGVSSVDELLETPKETTSGSNAADVENLPGSYGEMLHSKGFWILFIPIFAYCYLVYNLAFSIPAVIMELGWPASTVTAITSVTFVGTIIASPLGGIISDRVFKGRRAETVAIAYFISFLFMVLVVVVKGASVGTFSLMCMIAYSGVTLAAAPVWVLPASIFAPKFFAKGLGVMLFITNIAGVIGITISGVVQDATGSIMISYWITAGVALLGSIFALIFAKTYKK